MKVHRRSGDSVTVPADAPPRATTTPLDERSLFRGLKTILPFFLQTELSEDARAELSLAFDDTSPPALKAIYEDQAGGERALSGHLEGPDLATIELPTCGLLGCYLPGSKQIVLYRQGIDLACRLVEDGFRQSIPDQLGGRPLPELYSTHREQAEGAMRTYLRWLLVELVLMHQIGHAVVHLGLISEIPWHEPQRFERLPIKVHEHLAQSIVATSLLFKEITAPFPPSDLAAIFHRLCLRQPHHYRAWATVPPWRSRADIASTLVEIRENRVPLRLTSL